jgi:uncharacterized membrane protein (DUF485 family)
MATDAPTQQPVAQTATPGAGMDWERLRGSAEFHKLLRTKTAFVLPATVFFLVFYMLLPLGIAFAPDLMKTNLVGHINVAYVFALAQFVVTWVLTWLYIRRADRVFDPLAESVRRLAAGEAAGSAQR